jgi:dihydroxyacid dehydratase/phosphogluconate dehydratase
MKTALVLSAVTERLIERSRPHRAAYLQRIHDAGDCGPARGRLACANLAYGFAAAGPTDKQALRAFIKPNVAIVSAYNDMLSAHRPFETYPAQLKKAVLEAGGIAQFAGGVPAMCDGITQGRDGMQLSLFSRDVIAMATGIALSHDMFDAALMLEVCDKIVPGLLTDGRMSGASGKIPAAIHLTPEAAAGGPIAQIRDGDLITLDANAGTLELHIGQAELHARDATGHVLTPEQWVGTGRELFASMRAAVGPADQGASVFAPRSGKEIRVP